MGTIDNATWFALALTLTLLGLVGTVVAWKRRGPASAVRGLAWTLLPGAAYLTGTLKLLGNVLQDVTTWASNFVFNPTVWLGIVLAVISAVLFGTASFLRRKGVGTNGRPPRAAKAGKAGGPPAVTGRTGRTPAVQDEDLADIEAILKKHGIS